VKLLRRQGNTNSRVAFWAVIAVHVGAFLWLGWRGLVVAAVVFATTVGGTVLNARRYARARFR
jgi:hypothetical protein